MEEPLFTVRTVCTREDYIRFSRYLLRKVSLLGKSYFIFAAVVLIWTVSSAFSGQRLAWLPPLLVLLYISYAMTLGADRRAAKVYNSDPSLSSLKEGCEIRFFEEELRVGTTLSEEAFPYRKLSGIHITPTDIYLLREKNSGVLLRRGDAEQGLVEFLEGKKKEYGI
jgi:hypothetical protein